MSKHDEEGLHQAEREYLEQMVPEIEARKLKRSSVPMPIYLQEAENLVLWCSTDRERLLETGLAAEVLDGLAGRIEVARRAETFRRGFVERRKADTLYVRELLAEARALEREIVRDVRFAMKRFGNGESGLLRHVSKRKTDQSLPQNLSNLAVFCRGKSEELAAVGVSTDKADRAQDLSARVAEALAERRTRRRVETDLRVLRDRAFTHLAESVTEIRLCGRYVFHTNPERKVGYASAYRRKRKQDRGKLQP